MAVATIYGDVSLGGSITSSDAAYANARDGLGTLNVTVGDLAVAVGQFGTPYEVYETFLTFDTSLIRHGTITAVTLSIMDSLLPGAQAFTINARLDDWGTLDSGDFAAPAGLSGMTLVATLATAARVPASYNDFTDVALAANINKTGVTRLILSSSRHESGTAPTGDEFWELELDPSPPRLTITYEPGEEFAPFSGTTVLRSTRPVRVVAY